MKASELDKLKNSADIFRIKYDSLVSATEYEEKTVTDDAGATVLADYTRASVLYLSLLNNVSNAHNIKIQKKVIGQYGDDSYSDIATGKDMDKTGLTIIAP